jgi:hypothetical protein
LAQKEKFSAAKSMFERMELKKEDVVFTTSSAFPGWHLSCSLLTALKRIGVAGSLTRELK